MDVYFVKRETFLKENLVQETLRVPHQDPLLVQPTTAIVSGGSWPPTTAPLQNCPQKLAGANLPEKL